MGRRIYLDTNVIAGCIDETYAAWSNRLMDEIRNGWWIAVISDIATVSRVEVFVSWNFQRIVNLDRIRALHAVYLLACYPMMEIRSPMEVFHEEDH